MGKAGLSDPRFNYQDTERKKQKCIEGCGADPGWRDPLGRRRRLLDLLGGRPGQKKKKDKTPYQQKLQINYNNCIKGCTGGLENCMADGKRVCEEMRKTAIEEFSEQWFTEGMLILIGIKPWGKGLASSLI